MNTKFMSIAVVAAAALLLLPAALTAQVDPNANSSQPIGPQGASPTGAQPSGPPSSMRDSLGAPGETGQQMLDKQFLRSVTAGGIAEVKLGTLATQKGSPEVKTMAQQMVDDHAAILKDMAEAADSLGVMLPKKMDKDGQAEYEKLNGLSGKDFDTEYVTYTSKAHWQDVHAFYMEVSTAANPDLQAEVVKAMKTMRQHIKMIEETAKSEGITLPPRPPRPGATTTAKQ